VYTHTQILRTEFITMICIYLISVLLTNMTNCGILVSFSKAGNVQKGWFCNEVYEKHKCYSTFSIMLHLAMLTIRSNDNMVRK
jgi:hypothetical protein